MFGYLLSNPQESMFSKLGLTSKARTFQIRNNLRVYLEDMQPSSPEYHLNSIDNVSIDGAKNEYDTYKVWYDLMKNKNQRNLYSQFGDAVFCEFCKDDMDYAFYYTPQVLLSYLGMFIVIGLTTLSFQKALWRWPATIFAFSMLTTEISLIFMTKEVLDILQYSYKWDKASLARNALFLILIVAMLVKNRPNITDEDKHQVYCDELQALSLKSFNVAKVLQLKQQVELDASMGPTHPQKHTLLQHLQIEKEI